METNNMCREALKDAEKTLYDSSRSMYGIPPHMHALLARIRTALAAPIRNCEVGTAEEQAHRFHDFCAAHQSQMLGMCSPDCPCIGLADKCHCLTHWEQMPCEKGATDENK